MRFNDIILLHEINLLMGHRCDSDHGLAGGRMLIKTISNITYNLFNYYVIIILTAHLNIIMRVLRFDI